MIFLVVCVIMIKWICSSSFWWFKSDFKLLWNIKCCVLRYLLSFSRRGCLNFSCWFESLGHLLVCTLLFSFFLNSMIKIISDFISFLRSRWIKPPLRIHGFFPTHCSYLIRSPRISSLSIISFTPLWVVFHRESLDFRRNTRCSFLNSCWNLCFFWRFIWRRNHIDCKLFKLSCCCNLLVWFFNHFYSQ